MAKKKGVDVQRKMETKRVPNRAPEATRAENDETLIFNDSTKDFNEFSCLRATFGVKNGYKMGSKASWSALEASWSALEASWSALERFRGRKMLRPQFPRIFFEASRQGASPKAPGRLVEIFV